MQRTQVNIYPIEQFATSKVFDADPDARDISCSSGENEIEYRKKLKLKDFHWNFWTIRILTQGSMTMIFLVAYSSTSALFPIEILMEEFEFIVTEN